MHLEQGKLERVMGSGGGRKGESTGPETGLL